MADELNPYQEHDLEELEERMGLYRDASMPTQAESVYAGMEDLKALQEELEARFGPLAAEPLPTGNVEFEEDINRWARLVEAVREVKELYGRYEQEALHHLHAEMEAEAIASDTPYLDRLLAEATDRALGHSVELDIPDDELAMAARKWAVDGAVKAWKIVEELPEGAKRRAAGIGRFLRDDDVELEGDVPPESSNGSEGGTSAPTESRILPEEEAGRPLNRDMPGVGDPGMERTPGSEDPPATSRSPGAPGSGVSTPNRGNEDNFQRMRIEALRQDRNVSPSAVSILD